MKVIANLSLVFFLGVAIGGAQAQSGGASVTLRWKASRSSDTTVNIYREAGTCPPSASSTSGFTRIASNYPAGGPYTDSNVMPGKTYCYLITAVAAGTESLPSNPFQIVVPSPHTALKISGAVLAVVVVVGTVALMRARRSTPRTA
jgi:hypothetical protein